MLTNILVPSWISFFAYFPFLRIYNPTRQYLDRTAAAATSIFLAMVTDIGESHRDADLISVGSMVVIYSFYSSILYMVSGMLGSVIQQFLLLNDQSVQDKRFTDESEALANISSIILLMITLHSGFLFKPIIDVINADFYSTHTVPFLYHHITSSLSSIFIVASKYMILMLVITFIGGYIDIYFKKANFSSVIPVLKSIVIVFLLAVWLVSDEYYIYQQFVEE